MRHCTRVQESEEPLVVLGGEGLRREVVRRGDPAREIIARRRHGRENCAAAAPQDCRTAAGPAGSRDDHGPGQGPGDARREQVRMGRETVRRSRITPPSLVPAGSPLKLPALCPTQLISIHDLIFFGGNRTFASEEQRSMARCARLEGDVSALRKEVEQRDQMIARSRIPPALPLSSPQDLALGQPRQVEVEPCREARRRQPPGRRRLMHRLPCPLLQAEGAVHEPQRRALAGQQHIPRVVSTCA